MKNRAIIISAISVFILLGGGAITSNYFAFAQTDLKEIEGPYVNHPEIQDLNTKIKDKKDELDRLKEAALEYEKKLNSAKKESRGLDEQLDFLDNQITKMQLDIASVQTAIDKSKLEISSLQLQVEKEEQEIGSQKDKLREYIKLINKEDQRSTLEILLLNDSFSEFFNQLRYISDIQADLKKSIDRLTLLKDSLTVQKAELQNFKSESEKLKTEIENKQLTLKDQYSVKSNLLTETRRSAYKYERLISEADQIQDEVSSSINTIEDAIKEKIARIRSGNTDPKTTLMRWPLNGDHYITAYFHDPSYPYRYVFEHPAVDIRAKQSTPVIAPADGYVARARNGGYGYSYITLIHENGLATVYGHVSKIYVVPDQFVKAGDVIALSGATPGTPGAGPFTTGPHLHFETRLNGIPVDPLKYLP